MDQRYRIFSRFIYGSFTMISTCAGSGCAEDGQEAQAARPGPHQDNNEGPILLVQRKLLFKVKPQRRCFSRFGNGASEMGVAPAVPVLAAPVSSAPVPAVPMPSMPVVPVPAVPVPGQPQVRVCPLGWQRGAVIQPRAPPAASRHRHCPPGGDGRDGLRGHRGHWAAGNKVPPHSAFSISSNKPLIL